MRLLIAAATILISTLFLFVRLGHYSLWDDEANTALIGQGVWRTWDTSAILDHNIVAFRNGGELVGTKARYLPPLQYYVAAPFVGAFEPSDALARFPFALIGLFTILLMIVWLARTTNDPLYWWLVCFGIVVNVSLFLYCRQCRYYSLAIGSTVLAGYVYYHWKGRTWEIVLFAAALWILLASNYLNFLALIGCLIVDYAIWGRKRNPIDWKQLIAVAVPVIVLGAIVVLIWYPFGKSITASEKRDNWFVEHGTLLWWNLREINQNEFAVGLLALAAPIVALVIPGARFILRIWLAAVVYILVISIGSPQPTSDNGEADVRYLAPLIPLFIALNASVLAVIFAKHRKWAIPLSVILLGTNLANGGIYGGDNPRKFQGQILGFSSTVTRFIHELIRPESDPYRPVSEWMAQNIHAREATFVWPEYMLYPLMFQQPKPQYMWQLMPDQKNVELAKLPDIHFRGRGAPMYVIMFGPGRDDLFNVRKFPGEPYFGLVKQFPDSWFYAHRPELMWRDFPGDKRKIDKDEEFDKEKHAIYIYASRARSG